MTKEAKIYNGEETILSISGTVKVNSYTERNKVRIFSHTIYKNKVKIGERPKGTS